MVFDYHPGSSIFQDTTQYSDENIIQCSSLNVFIEDIVRNYQILTEKALLSRSNSAEEQRAFFQFSVSFIPPLILLSLNANLLGRENKASLSTLRELGMRGGGQEPTPASTPSSPDLSSLQTFMSSKPSSRNIVGSGAMEMHSLQEKLPVVSLGTWKPLQCHSRSQPLLSAASSLTPYNHLHWASSLPWIFYEFFYHGKLQTYPKVQPPGTLYLL